MVSQSSINNTEIWDAKNIRKYIDKWTVQLYMVDMMSYQRLSDSTVFWISLGHEHEPKI